MWRYWSNSPEGFSESLAAAPITPSRTHARSPTLQARNPKKAAQNSKSSNFMRQATPSSAYGWAVRYQHGGGLSCDRAPSICEFAPYHWRGGLKAVEIAAGQTALKD